jgi:hypothetical protein
MNLPNIEELIRKMNDDSRHARATLARDRDSFPPI